jgi:hypothetical protein
LQTCGQNDESSLLQRERLEKRTGIRGGQSCTKAKQNNTKQEEANEKTKMINDKHHLTIRATGTKTQHTIAKRIKAK